MGIGPSTKETSLHHFRDPLLDVVSSDTDLDLMGIIIVGTPDDNEDNQDGCLGRGDACRWRNHLFGRMGKQRRGLYEYMRAAGNERHRGDGP